MREYDGMCAITEASNNLFHETKVAISSFLDKNKWFDGHLIILCTEQLSSSNILALNLIYKKSEVHLIDKSLILSDGGKRGDLFNPIDYLFPFIFNIKSKGNIYFSRNTVFMNEVSNLLDNDNIVAPFNSPEFSAPNLDSEIDYRLMFVPEKYLDSSHCYGLISTLNESTIFNIAEDIRCVNSYFKDKYVSVMPIHSTTLVKSSMFPDKKYTKFVRYLGSMSALLIDTRHVKVKVYTRIHAYWTYANKKYAKWLSTPTNHNIAENPKAMKSASAIGNKLVSPLSTNTGNTLKDRNIGLCTICDDKFIPGLITMLHSFTKHNPWFDKDIIVLYESTYSQISKSNRELVSSLFENVIFKEVKINDYINLINLFKKRARGKPNILRLIPSLFTFEIFDIVADYETLLYLDSDMVVLNDISELFSINSNIIVTPDAGEYDLRRKYRTFNGGFMVLKNEAHKSNHKKGLLNYANRMKSMGLADQTIMNGYFNDSLLLYLDARYNCLKRCFRDSNFSAFSKDIKIIHYVGAKPWIPSGLKMEQHYKKIEQIWHKYHNESKSLKVKEKNSTPKRILIVGNSPNVLNTKKGKEIDGFDKVIRINDFKIGGFEEYTGTKATHWVTSFSPAIDVRPTNNFEKIFTANPNHTPEVFLKRINRIVPTDQLRKVYLTSTIDLVKLNRDIGYRDKNKWPTTGMLAIFSAIKEFKDSEIYFHGFSFFKEGGPYVSHYWKEHKKEEFNKHHTHSLEEKYINSLVESGRLKTL